MKNIKVNDVVYIYDEFTCGQVVEVKEDTAYVEFSTSGGGGCLPFNFSELGVVWCITKFENSNEIGYLCWNPLNSEYFWTNREIVSEMLPYNNPNHQFLFHSRNVAIKNLKKMNISQKCKVIIF